jgi:hypothetical protein
LTSRDEAGHVLGLFQIHAGHGLVKQQDLGFHGQGPGQLNPFLQTIGQGAHHLFTDRLDLQQVYDALFYLFSNPHLFALGLTPVKAAGYKPGVHVHMVAQLDVVQDRHALEQLDVLEAARNAQAGNLMGGHLGDVPVFKDNAAFAGVIKAADAVEDAGFTGSIGADDGLDMAVLHLKAHSAQGIEPAEA